MFEAEVNRAVIASNPGIAIRKGKVLANGQTRVACLKDAIVKYPNIIRMVDGQVRSGVALDRFERRQVDVDAWEKTLADAAPGQVHDVFGSWCDWSWGPEASSWLEPMQGRVALADGDVWEVDFVVDIEKFAAYASSGQDPRQGHVEEFLKLCQDAGLEMDGRLVSVPHVGRQKVVSGTSMGRYFFGAASYPALSRFARQAAYPTSAVEFDMPNAIVHFAVQVGTEHGLPMVLFKKYLQHKSIWRQAVSQWLQLGLEDSKKMLLRACYGYAFPSQANGVCNICPLLDGLATEGLALRQVVCAKYPGVVSAMSEANRPRPETSALAMVLLDHENKWMREFVTLLPKHNFRLVATVYDAVVAMPSTHAQQEALLSEFEGMCGLRMQVKQGSDLHESHGVWQALVRLTEQGKGVGDSDMEPVAGDGMCIPTAVVNLFPDAAVDVKGAFAAKSGPWTYSQFLHLCPQFRIEVMAWADVTNLPSGSRLLLHEHVEHSGCGHAWGLVVEDAQVLVVSSEHAEMWRGNKAAFWAELGGLFGLKCFRSACFLVFETLIVGWLL